MKKHTLTTIGALSFGSLLAVSTAYAQFANQLLIANIPFAFSAGGQTLPAGSYKVSLLSPDSDQDVLRIVSLDGAWKAIVRTHPKQDPDEKGSKLVFHRYGDRYFLAQAWLLGARGRETPKSQAERSVEHELGSNPHKIETIALSTRP